jgi:transcriptional regulator with XRE-family HTH domain
MRRVSSPRLSQERLALNLDIDRGNLASLERGVHTPRLYTIARLLLGLHITFVEFIQEFERILKEVIAGEAAALPPTRRRSGSDLHPGCRLRRV